MSSLMQLSQKTGFSDKKIHRLRLELTQRYKQNPLV